MRQFHDLDIEQQALTIEMLVSQQKKRLTHGFIGLDKLSYDQKMQFYSLNMQHPCFQILLNFLNSDKEKESKDNKIIFRYRKLTYGELLIYISDFKYFIAKQRSQFPTYWNHIYKQEKLKDICYEEYTQRMYFWWSSIYEETYDQIIDHFKKHNSHNHDMTSINFSKDSDINLKIQLYFIVGFLNNCILNDSNIGNSFAYLQVQYYKENECFFIGINFQDLVEVEYIQNLVQKYTKNLENIQVQPTNEVYNQLLLILYENQIFDDDSYELLREDVNSYSNQCLYQACSMFFGTNKMSYVKIQEGNSQTNKKIKQKYKRQQKKLLDIEKKLETINDKLFFQEDYEEHILYSEIWNQQIWQVDQILEKKIFFFQKPSLENVQTKQSQIKNRQGNVRYKYFYKVKWVCDSIEQCTWEPQENVQNLYSYYFKNVNKRYEQMIELRKQFLKQKKYIESQLSDLEYDLPVD